MTLLSFDQSSRITGWAVFVDEELKDFGKFTFEDSDIGTRLFKIRSKVIELINQYHPDEIVFEDIQQQNNVTNNVQTFKILAEVYGVISELLTELQIPYSTTLASSWKSTLGIKGRTRPEQKKNAQQYVMDKFKVKPTQDECDAVCIGEAYIRNHACPW